MSRDKIRAMDAEKRCADCGAVLTQEEIHYYVNCCNGCEARQMEQLDCTEYEENAMAAKFEIHGEAKGKGRVRFAAGRAYTPQATVLYEKLVKTCYAEQCGGIWFDGALCVTIRAYTTIPKSASKKAAEAMERGEARPTKKPDLDNIAKCILDALNGVAYGDDCQVVGLTVSKQWARAGRVVVEICSGGK